MTAKHLLVTTSYALILLNTQDGSHQILDTGAGLYFGLALRDGKLWVAARRRMVSSGVPQTQENGEIRIFEGARHLMDRWQAPFPLRDLHQIAWVGEDLWVTCCFDNLVAIRHPNGDWERWFPLGQPESEPFDRNHFNSLWVEGSRVCILAHNRDHPPSELLFFDSRSRTLLDRLPLGDQAHNVWRVGDEYCTCSSREGRLIGHRGFFAVETGGFPRGVARIGDEWFIGISQLAERDARDLTTGQIAVFDANWREKRRIPLTNQGLILDLLPV
ncbi:MAG: hypothetical protein WCP34_09880 [Pseudomonadota bacterium]